MILKIDLDRPYSCCKKAINKLEKVIQNNLVNFNSRFARLIYENIVANANKEIMAIQDPLDWSYDIEEIMKGWVFVEIGNNVFKVYNSKQSATYLEFGIGRTAIDNGKHDLASEMNYVYNVDSPYKYEKISEDGSSYTYWKYGGIETSGYQATSFLYNSYLELIYDKAKMQILIKKALNVKE